MTYIMLYVFVSIPLAIGVGYLMSFNNHYGNESTVRVKK